MNDLENGSNIFALKPKEGKPWDVAVIGSGPAGLTSSIYTTRGAASTIIFGGEKWGGQLMLTTTVDNYPALPGVQGPDLMQRMKDHATSFGGEFIQKNVESLDFSSDIFEIIAAGSKYQVRSVIVATGADNRWLGVPGEKELIGRGVSSCAPCDAPFFKNKKVIVVGGGDSAMEEALVLSKYASHVTMVHRRDQFKASQAMQQKVFSEEKAGKINILWNSQIAEIGGGDKVQKAVIKNNDGSMSDLAIDGIFVAIGHLPATNIFKGKLELDEKSYVKKMPHERYQMATSVPGVFVAGDVHDYHFRQAITAAGFGCMAGMEVLHYLDKPIPAW